jgi:hypothetical protein
MLTIKRLTLGAWNRFRANTEQYLSPDMATCLGLYAFLAGVANWMAQRWLAHRAMDLYVEWTAAYTPEAPTYNVPFVDYVMGIVVIIGGVFLYSFFSYLPKRYCRLFGLADFLWRKALGITLFFLFIAPLLSKILFLASAVLLGQRALREREFIPAKYGPKAKLLSGFLMMALIVASMGMGAKAWYPFVLANDYVEIPDAVFAPPREAGQAAAPLAMEHADAIDCLTQIDQQTSIAELANSIHILNDDEKRFVNTLSQTFDTKPETSSRLLLDLHGIEVLSKPEKVHCRFDVTQQQMNQLRSALTATSAWQSYAGRLLYHHAYVYVPAAHFLRYGLSSPIPYLYGVGNTLFHAFLMAGKPPTLTNYFNTFPLAQLAGLLSIVGMVFYIARSWLAVAAAFALSLIYFWLISPDAIHMAPGFSPLRYGGLALQMASVFVLARRPNFLRTLFVAAALGFSLFWNEEFGLLGFFGQMLAVIAPRIALRPITRAFGIGALGLVAIVALILLNKLSSGFLQTAQSGLFGIGMPPAQSRSQFFDFCLLVGILALGLGYCATRFPAAERAARFSTLPVIALLLIKYIYNTSDAHLFYSLVFIAPSLLIYWDWQNHAVLPRSLTLEQKQMAAHFVVLMATLFCLLFSVRYYHGAKTSEAIRINPFVQHVWSDLGESLATVTPEQPIAARIQAVRDEMRPDDVVLFLSPFDHLMSLYANPQNYCGHFEVLSNLTTHQTVASVVDCVRNSPRALVVYDDALKKTCPESWPQFFYYDNAGCVRKRKLKMTLQSVMEVIKPDLVLVKQSGALSFYRHGGSDAPVP